MNETTFENAKVGDKVWTVTDDWGEIVEIIETSEYPIIVEFEACQLSFTVKGFYYETEKRQSLFWNEIKYEIPTRPKRKSIKKIECWMNIYSDGDNTIHKTKDKANENACTYRIACIKLTGEYEVEE